MDTKQGMTSKDWALMATVTREREALIEKLRRAAASIYIAVDEAVARDISTMLTDAGAAPPQEDQ